MNRNDKMSILVCSCDKYADIWTPMFKMFFKFWSDCPYKVYLMTNHKKCENERVISLNIGDDISWSLGFRKALQMIEEEYVFVIMEDYILKKSVDYKDFEDLIDYMKAENAVCVRTMPSLYADEPGYGMFKQIRIGEVKRNDPYRISLQAGMWNRNYLISIIDDKDSAWEFEHMGSKRSRYDHSKILCTIDKENIIFDYYCTGVIQGYWVQEAIDLCEANGVYVDLNRRPVETEKIRNKRIHNERDFVKLKKFLKNTFIYDLYRAQKFGKRK